MRRRFVVRGRVQGVNFRATAADAARTFGLTGRVWNRDDGAVECVAEGDDGALERMEQWLSHGPRMARVEDVEARDLDGAAEYADFRVG